MKKSKKTNIHIYTYEGVEVCIVSCCDVAFQLHDIPFIESHGSWYLVDPKDAIEYDLFTYHPLDETVEGAVSGDGDEIVKSFGHPDNCFFGYDEYGIGRFPAEEGFFTRDGALWQEYYREVCSYRKKGDNWHSEASDMRKKVARAIAGFISECSEDLEDKDADEIEEVKRNNAQVREELDLLRKEWEQTVAKYTDPFGTWEALTFDQIYKDAHYPSLW